jgi:Ca2+-binding RTX toxin-like protein
VLGAACALVVLAWLPAGVAHAATTATATFSSPGQYSFAVPPGVTSIAITAVGAPGGGCVIPELSFPNGGKGAAVSAAVTVLPGEGLLVGVGGPGGNADSRSSADPARGGIGGGGAGGDSPPASIACSGGGGGASLVGFGSPSPGFPGVLVVAGGGGGGNTLVAGGDSGSPGGAYQCGDCGGKPGTLTGGGAGGVGDPRVAEAGTSGSLGLGGNGGGCKQPACGDGGGGGGGGYYGGGGASAGVGDARGDVSGGAGGGGGSSFVVSGATNASMALTSDPPSVSITYAVPTADESTTTMDFGTQPPGTASPAQTLTVTNKGSAPLVVSGVQLGGDDPDDFLVGDRCQQPVPVGSSCQVGVRFHPQATGARSATLTVLTNAPSPPAAVALSGGPSATTTCADRAATRGGSAGADELAGTRGSDVLAGGPGDDRIGAGGGNDLICAGPGNDRVVGGAGDDRVVGGQGNDRVVGGQGNDRVVGGQGNDRLFGGEGQDSLDGGAGNDTLTGGGGRDTLNGSSGSDTLNGSGGSDTLEGGPGDDGVDARDGAPDQVRCGDGADVVRADPSDHLTGCEDIRR